MKKFIIALAALTLMALPSAIFAQTYSAQSGVSFFTQQSATAMQVTGPVRLPTFSGTGTLTVTEAGITGSPSGCTIKLAFQGNNSVTPTAAVSTTSFAPSTGVQTFVIAPSIASGDNYVATYACSSTYPTAGTITASFSPVSADVLVNIAGQGDPCQNPGVAKSSVAVSITTATTTQLVALSTGKVVYACGFSATVGASSTIAFEYGTGTTCGTGTTALTGTYTPATGELVAFSAEGAHFQTPVSNALCALSTGTGGIYGMLTYIVQ